MATNKTTKGRECTLFAAIELSKSTWLLAVQTVDAEQPSLHHVPGGDADALVAQLERARDRQQKRTGQPHRIVVCYEAGYDGFWLWRLLEARGITCNVIDAASIEMSRRSRRPKTDRIDATKLVRVLMAWSRGERDVCSMVRIPTCDEEDVRRSHRERSRLINEQTAHTNRIKGLLFAYGIRDFGCRCDRLVIGDLVTGDGRQLPVRLRAEIEREIARLKLIREQIAEVEKERDRVATPCVESEKKRLQLLAFRGIGPTLAAILTREVYYRSFDNRRQVASYIGLAPSPHDSGQSERCHGISKAGNSLVRGVMVEAAWLWLRHQPESQLSNWFNARTSGNAGRIRRIMIVALARKLAVALWRYLETGLVPHGATLKETTAA